MPSYNPNCDNCFRCMTCKGNGYVAETYSDGKLGKVGKRDVTCKTCRGVGGKPGAGKHGPR